jgi:hypothetical protein
MPQMPVMSKKMRIYLHSNLQDLTKEIVVYINGKKIRTRAPKAGILRNMDKNDPGFKFEDYMDIKL